MLMLDDTNRHEIIVRCLVCGDLPLQYMAPHRTLVFLQTKCRVLKDEKSPNISLFGAL